MNVSVLVPTRGDRPQFLANAKRIINSQTLKPTHIEIVDDAPMDPSKKDITWRYRIGCERILKNNPGTDCIMLMEDDDWYSVNYVETMVNNWVKDGRPDVYGLGDTIYYHLGLRGWFVTRHPNRASAMSTMMSAEGAKMMRWPNDNFTFTDLEIWKVLRGKTFLSSPPIAVGMKHAIGMCGGRGHVMTVQYKNKDAGFDWLRSIVDKESFDFYVSLNIKA